MWSADISTLRAWGKEGQCRIQTLTTEMIGVRSRASGLYDTWSKTSRLISSFVKASRVILRRRYYADRNNSPLGYRIWIYRDIFIAGARDYRGPHTRRRVTSVRGLSCLQRKLAAPSHHGGSISRQRVRYHFKL